MDQRELLKSFYLFTGVTPNDLDALEAIVERKAYIAGDHVFNEGDVADAMFLVEMGAVDLIPRDKQVAFATIGSGQGFGELAFFERGPRPAGASARERSQLLRIPFERFSQVLAERPGLALLVYRNGCAFFAKHFRSMAVDWGRRYL